ncbi:MAG: hypothetical protein IJF48_01555 [Clostridia bacterium]|nr:hypothetical protein [Clostridia bacterium]
MVHTFKFGGQRIAYDSVSGLVLPLSELAYKMLDYIELPMPKTCSSALRYDLAKYDSAAISQTYNELYALYRDGKLFAKDESDTYAVCHGGVAVKIGDVLCTRADPHILDIVKRLADAEKDVSVSIVDAPENVAAFTDEDVPTLQKQFEKIAKEQVKRARGTAEGASFTAFESRAGAVHEEEPCAGCWACKLCSLISPQSTKCELEKKRVECAMMCETAIKE